MSAYSSLYLMQYNLSEYTFIYMVSRKSDPIWELCYLAKYEKCKKIVADHLISVTSTETVYLG
jgi:hypothetical protein